MANTAKTQITAQDAFLSAKADVDAALAALTSLSADHFCATNPESVHWGDVGIAEQIRDDLGRMLRLLGMQVLP
jgi:hypothetical protein